MRYADYLCLGGVEIVNGMRTGAYVRNLGVPGLTMAAGCGDCEALEDPYLTYSSPAEDDAPWYESMRPESDDFLGIVNGNITINSPYDREVTSRGGEGGILGSLALRPRIVSVTGTMVARSALGMAYGESWIREALRGSFCQGDCVEDDLELLPVCPTDVAYEDSGPYFRTLVQTGIVEGPLPAQIQEAAECYIQAVGFQLTSQMPYLYTRPEKIIDAEVVGPYNDEVCGLVTTNGWPGDATLIITIEADATTDLADVLITGKTSLDGSCPYTGGAGMPCFTYDIPTMTHGGVLTIDGSRRQVNYYDPSSKKQMSGLSQLRVERFFDWPDVPPCTDLCVCVENNAGGDVTVTVEQVNREL